METKGILEVAIDSVESAIHAEKGGADRFELCGDLIVGGITPSLSLYERVREKTSTKTHVLVRPRFGDFLYREEELEVLLKQVSMYHKAGADAIVTGILTREGDLDIEAMKRVMEAAKDTKVNLHRAFDMCRDMDRSLLEAEKLGIHTILTSGGSKSAVDGIKALERFQKIDHHIIIMAGAGVNKENIPFLHEKAGINTFHMSGKVTLESEMIYRNPKVNMGLEGLSEYEIIETSEENIREARAVIDALYR